MKRQGTIPAISPGGGNRGWGEGAVTYRIRLKQLLLQLTKRTFYIVDVAARDGAVTGQSAVNCATES